MIYYNAFKDFQELFGLDVGPMKELSEYETQKMYEIYEIKEKNRNQHIYIEQNDMLLMSKVFLRMKY